jgi:hypothetical protein
MARKKFRERWKHQGLRNPGAVAVLSNMESINALLIQQGLSQSQRLIHLNKTAITQMKSLLENKTIKNLK